jgi:hypothetical protein
VRLVKLVRLLMFNTGDLMRPTVPGSTGWLGGSGWCFGGWGFERVGWLVGWLPVVWVGALAVGVGGWVSA